MSTEQVEFKVGRDWCVHFAARYLAFYATQGGVDKHDRLLRTLDQVRSLHTGLCSSWAADPKIAPELQKRLVLAIYSLCPATKLRGIIKSNAYVVLEHFDKSDQEKIVNILETYYGLGH